MIAAVVNKGYAVHQTDVDISYSPFGGCLAGFWLAAGPRWARSAIVQACLLLCSFMPGP